MKRSEMWGGVSKGEGESEGERKGDRGHREDAS